MYACTAVRVPIPHSYTPSQTPHTHTHLTPILTLFIHISHCYPRYTVHTIMITPTHTPHTLTHSTPSHTPHSHTLHTLTQTVSSRSSRCSATLLRSSIGRPPPQPRACQRWSSNRNCRYSFSTVQDYQFDILWL